MKKIGRTQFDVIIVGAGPAGCSVANTLSGYETLLLDWSKFPRDKPCGGLLVEECAESIKKFDIENKVLMYPKISCMRYVDWNNNLEYEEKRNLWNVNRRSFDYTLLKFSENKVQFSSETKFLNFEQNNSSVRVLIEKNNKKFFLEAKYLIGADGASSSIRRKISTNNIPYYFVMQEWIRIKNIEPHVVYFIYDNEITDYYSWIIPKGKYTIIGSAIKKGDNTYEKLQLLKKKIKDNLNLSGIPLRKEGAIGLRPSNSTDVILGKDNVLLVGEAAGLISPSSGEGISFALESGERCAKAIIKNPDNPLNEYEKLCESLLSNMNEKIQKSIMISDPLKRIELLKYAKK